MKAGAHALWSHWARHRLQLGVVIVGLALATGLWTGVQAINAEARASYDRAANALGQTQFAQITRVDAPLRLQDFVALRRAGWLVTPIVQGTLRGTGIEVLGFDPFTAPIDSSFPDLSGEGDLSAFILHPGIIFVHPDTVDRLPENLPPYRILDAIPPGQIVTDLSVAMSLLRKDTLSSILLLDHQVDMRLPLRALGLSQRGLMFLLSAEAFVFATIGGGIGVFLGYIVAALLLPGVAATLSGLYGASVSGSLSLSPVWWLIGFAMAYLGAAAAVSGSLWQLSKLSILAPAMPRAWSRAGIQTARLQAFGGIILMILAVMFGLLGNSLVAGFVCLAAMLLGAALLVPLFLTLIVSLLSRWGTGAITQWIWADTRQQIQPMSLALMALMLALAANVGVSTMVGSFRSTFTGWLDQRLASDLYITTRTPIEAAAMQEFVSPHVDSILPIVSAEVNLAGSPGQVFGIKDHDIYRDHWPLLEATSDVWDRVAAGEGVLVNEQLARREELWTGAELKLANGWHIEIVGVYSDYGNPAGQAFINYEVFKQRYPDITPLRFAISAANPSDVRERIVTEFGLPGDNTINWVLRGLRYGRR